MNKNTISAVKKPLPKIGMLYDSYNKNTGDKATGIVVADFLSKAIQGWLKKCLPSPSNPVSARNQERHS